MIVIEGLERVVSDFVRAGATANARATKAVGDTAEKVGATGRDLAPKLTGELAASISIDHQGLTAEIGPEARYGRFVEYGTYKDAPQPFMGPAIDQHEDDFVAAMEELGDI